MGAGVAAAPSFPRASGRPRGSRGTTCRVSCWGLGRGAAHTNTPAPGLPAFEAQACDGDLASRPRRSAPALPAAGSEARGVTGRAEPDSGGPSRVCPALPPAPLAGLWAPLALVSSTEMERPFPTRQSRTQPRAGAPCAPETQPPPARGERYVNVGFSSPSPDRREPSSGFQPQVSMATGEELTNNRTTIGQTCAIIVPITQDWPKNNEIPHCLHVKTQLLF